MQNPVATIVSIDGDTAIVSVERSVACARCASGKGCGAGLLASPRPAVILQIGLPTDAGLQVGDQVSLSIEPSALLRGAIYLYAYPLLGMVLALTLGWLATGDLADGPAILLALAGLLAGLALARYRIQRRDCLEQFVPRLSLGSSP